ncbi:MAG: type transport system ATP-binding protein [Microbacteriaceae bacterium]|nr:type transport system ATP-binding protein [Microbacteriaceae bacterium]
MTGPADDSPAHADEAGAAPAPRKSPAKRATPARRPAADGQPAARAAKTTAAGAQDGEVVPAVRKAPAARNTPAAGGAEGAEKAPAARRTPAARATASAGTTKADRPVRPAAARQAPGTGRSPRATKAAPADPAPTHEAPPTREAAPADAGAGATTTQLLPVPEDGAERPTKELPGPDDHATEILTPVRAPGAPEPDTRSASSEPADATQVLTVPPATGPTATAPVLRIRGLTKRFGATVAVDAIDLTVEPGSFFGIVGPNGAGKTTTLSMVTGLLRPDAGSVHIHGIDVWREPERAKRAVGVLPDAVRLFDRLSGAQLLYYSGVLRGLDAATVKQRSADLIAAFGLEDAAGRLVADYSAGMTKKVALACSMIHSPRLLVLDEPFESVDPVSAANIVEILQRYVRSGGTVVLSSHGMDMIQRVCDHVAIVIAGRVLAAGTTDEVRGSQSLEDRFVELAGGRRAVQGLEWLHSFSD